MDISLEDARSVRRQVVNAVTTRFKRRFSYFVAGDILLAVVAFIVGRAELLIGALASVILVLRTVAGLAVLLSGSGGGGGGHAIGAYSSIMFHRESLMRRFAHSSHMTCFALWIATSHVLAAFLVFSLLFVGVIAVVLSFSGSGVLGGFATLATLLFASLIALYLVATERMAYAFCVTKNVDEVLRRCDVRRAYVVASAALHNERTERLFNQKCSALILARSLGRSRLAYETQATRGGETPDAKHNRENHE